MTSDDTTPASGATTRRAWRAQRGQKLSSDDTNPGILLVGEGTDASLEQGRAERLDGAEQDARGPYAAALLQAPRLPQQAEWADAARPATALTWLDTADVVESTCPASLNAVPTEDPGPSLLTGMPQRPARWLAPLGALAAPVLAYAIAMLVWPLHAITPTVTSVEFTTTPAAVTEITWPTEGSAGVGIEGVSSAASSTDAASIASITKVVSTLMVLDRLPLQVGEQGPEYGFSYGDSIDYWNYRRANQSSLDVPVDGVLTEYQMLQGILLGSANNYIDRLARELWGSDDEFRAAAADWLAERGLSDITVVSPSGFDEGNVASPDALIRLGELAMQNPVFAEIVGTRSVELPGAGLVKNSNGMLADPDVTGIKTGTLDGWSILTSKDVKVGDTTVHLFAAVLNQADDDERLAVTRSLFSQVEAALNDLAPAVPAGTVVGEVRTIWGAKSDIVTDEDATVVLWNGATPTTAIELALDESRTAGDAAGTLTVDGPIDSSATEVSLSEDVPGPTPWWRLTHPLDLLGINSD